MTSPYRYVVESAAMLSDQIGESMASGGMTVAEFDRMRILRASLDSFVSSEAPR